MVASLKETWRPVILVDLNMPEMDGFECTTVLRKMEDTGYWPKRQAIRIVAVTANASPAVVQECLDVGMNGCISKPISMKMLQEMVDLA